MKLNNDFMKVVIQSDNESYEVEAIFQTEKQVNDYLSLHPNSGVIATDNTGNIFIANVWPRRSIEVTFANGDKMKTDINGTVEHIRNYYLGKTFNVGLGPNDNMQKAVSIKFFDRLTQ